MINEPRAGETSVWDLIDVNPPWARNQPCPEGLIGPLPKGRFVSHLERTLPEFADLAQTLPFAEDGELIGMPQRCGPFGFVVDTDVVGREMAEDQGWNVFLDPAMADRFGVLTCDDWNVIHVGLAGGLNPFAAVEGEALEAFRSTARQIFGGAKLLRDDLVAISIALIDGEIGASFTGGTYTASPARHDGGRRRPRRHARCGAGRRQGRGHPGRADLGRGQARPQRARGGLPRVRPGPRHRPRRGHQGGHPRPGGADGRRGGDGEVHRGRARRDLDGLAGERAGPVARMRRRDLLRPAHRDLQRGAPVPSAAIAA